ncbi:hypothetical protein KJ813_07235 [bacterium]|nr:hypothetical protein [bacterium]MBU4362435.1 hypothetical protein [bacterium]
MNNINWLNWLKWVFSGGIGTVLLIWILNKLFSKQKVEVKIEQSIQTSEFRKIAQSVFKENFYNLKEVARETAHNRSNEFIEDVIKTLSDNPKNFDTFSEPSMQANLFEAQKAYAKSGERYLKILLLNYINNIAKAVPKSLTRIILEESIKIVPKLTIRQCDMLSLIFLMLYSPNYNLSKWEDFETLLKDCIYPFIESLSDNVTNYRHLEYTGCVFSKPGHYMAEELFQFYYPEMFSSGFTIERFKEKVDINVSKYKNDGTIIRCFYNANLYQINAIYKDDINKKGQEKNYNNTVIFKLNRIQKEHSMNGDMVRNSILRINKDFEKLFSIWNNSYISHLELTSIGVSIAISNIERKLGMSLDYSIWLNEESSSENLKYISDEIPRDIL